MNSFISCHDLTRRLLIAFVSCDELHAKWINTLSFMENCGARMIAACEHPTLVREEMLKHASEEFRHAHHLKRQLSKVSSSGMKTYSVPFILGGFSTLHYLKTLDLKISRYLKGCGLSANTIKEAAYLLVTYAIELRAGELYGLYDEVLRTSRSKVAVKSILLEEEEHLNEMIEGLKRLPSGFTHARYACAIEGELCQKWLYALLDFHFKNTEHFV